MRSILVTYTMTESKNNPRQWLVTGLRYREVKDYYPVFLSELKEGTILQVYAAHCTNGFFSNLGAFMSWRGKVREVGVISKDCRDAAAIYLDDEGFMEVRVVKDTIGDKDFWVEPVLDAPLRPDNPHSKLLPLPFDENLVPYRTNNQPERLFVTRELERLMQTISMHIEDVKWTELRSQVLQLADLLHDYPPYCLHSLCVEERNRLRDIINRLKGLLERLRTQSGMADCALRLEEEFAIIEDVKREYTKEEVCARIYREEMAELDAHAILSDYHKQLRMDNNGREPTPEMLSSNLSKINAWLKVFLNGWYVRWKRENNLVKLAHTIMSAQLTRKELYGYYCCEIIARALEQQTQEQSPASGVPVQTTGTMGVEPPLSTDDAPNSPSDEELDPERIILGTLDKQEVRAAVQEAEAFNKGKQYRYALLMKVMMDHRIITIQQSDQVDFARSLVCWLPDKALDARKTTLSIRQGFTKMMKNQGLVSPQVLPFYWLWKNTDKEWQLCTQIGEVFERHGFPRPKAVAE